MYTETLVGKATEMGSLETPKRKAEYTPSKIKNIFKK
jgi:hypothetical protein